MNRRDALLVGGSTAVAHVRWTTVAGCGAQGTPSGTTPTPPATGPDAELARRANDCALSCDTCVTASLGHVSRGMSAMLDCIRLARDCAVLCRAVSALATSGNERLAALAAVCAAQCDACAAQGQSHAQHEPACAACAPSSAACAEACRAAA